MNYICLNRHPRIARETWLYAAWLLIAGALAMGLVVQTERLTECEAWTVYR